MPNTDTDLFGNANSSAISPLCRLLFTRYKSILPYRPHFCPCFLSTRIQLFYNRFPAPGSTIQQTGRTCSRTSSSPCYKYHLWQVFQGEVEAVETYPDFTTTTSTSSFVVAYHSYFTKSQRRPVKVCIRSFLEIMYYYTFCTSFSSRDEHILYLFSFHHNFIISSSCPENTCSHQLTFLPSSPEVLFLNVPVTHCQVAFFYSINHDNFLHQYNRSRP